MIEFNNVSFNYTAPTGITEALCGVNATLKRGSITAVIGHTGSGKSTFMELAAGITSPSTGSVTLDGCTITHRRDKIGMVFQYPESQLFADTVMEDIAFGPSNQGIKGEALKERIAYAANITGLSDKILKMSPFGLSGGQKRMAAIAGVIAMKPEILLLDEPAAGLDPSGRELIFKIINQLLESDPNMIIAFVTHSMNDAAEYSDHIILLDHGCVAADGTPEDVFKREELLLSCGLDVPMAVKIANELKLKGIDIGSAVTADDLFFSILKHIKNERNCNNAS